MKKVTKYLITGAAAGVVWGLISTIFALINAGEGFQPVHYVLFLPFTLGFGFLELVFGTGMKVLGLGLLSWIVYFTFPMLVGALLGILACIIIKKLFLKSN